MNNKINYLFILLLFLVSCKKKGLTENSSETKEQPNIQTKNAQIQNSIDPATATTIEFENKEYNYGAIPKNTKVTHYFSFANTGNKPLSISSVQPSCGCTVPKFPTKPVMPGQKDSIMLEFNSTNFSGEIHKSATVFANTLEPIILKFSGNIAN